VKKSALLLSLCMTASLVAPALAAESQDNLDKVVQGSLIGPRLTAAACGMVMGTPVAAMRDTYKNYISMTTAVADKIGGHEFGPSCAVASVFTIPASIVVGSGLGLYHGMKNGMGGYNRPYAPDTFSMTSNYDE
jgi:hypothetical protein